MFSLEYIHSHPSTSKDRTKDDGGEGDGVVVAVSRFIIKPQHPYRRKSLGLQHDYLWWFNVGRLSIWFLST